MWMACSLQAHYRYDLHLPRQQNAAASFGSVLHDALEYLVTTGDYTKAKSRFLWHWHHPEEMGLPSDDTWYWPKTTSHAGYLKLGLQIIEDFHERTRFDKGEVLGLEVPFMVPFGEHHLMGYIDKLEIRKNGKGVEMVRIIDYKSKGTQPTIAQLMLDIQFCADADTEILSADGWKRYDALQTGEQVLTLDHDTGLAQWQPVEAVNVFDAEDQEMLLMEGKAHSSLTTLSHRWPVEHTVSSKTGWHTEKRVILSEGLTGADRITCAAPVLDLPVEPKYSDATVELVGWFWTEGHVVRGGSISIAQSEPGAHAVRSALTRKFGPASETLRNTALDPRWRESRDDDVTRFYLNRLASEIIKPHVVLPSKAIRPSFIASLTRSQLRLLVDVSVRADGHTRNGCTVVSQSDRSRLDSLQMAYALLGERTSLRQRKVGGNGSYAGRLFWELSVKDRRPNFRPKRDVQSRVRYTGKVWCPTTANGTWLARRNGQIYFTGNTVYMYAVGCKEFWVGMPDPSNPDVLEGEEPPFPGLPDGEALWERCKDMPAVAIWYHLRKQKEMDAGPRDQHDFMRLYRVCDEIRKASEAEIFVPKIGEACGLCDYVRECEYEIPVELTINPDDPLRWV